MTNGIVETGTVKFFDPKRRYGFIVDERGRDVYFNEGGLAYIDEVRGRVAFTESILLDPDFRLLPDEKIVFCRQKTMRGPVARPWGLASRWEAVDAGLKRVNPPSPAQETQQPLRIVSAGSL